MLRPVRRRSADPAVVQKLWEAIMYIRQQKQIPNIDRITRYMIREYEMNPNFVEVQLQYTVDDCLVGAYTAVGVKGSKIGTEQEGFKIPEFDSIENDSHDWYCYECHKPGEVIECTQCWRVYHEACTSEADHGGSYICRVCRSVKKKNRIRRKELNRLLLYTVYRLKEKARPLQKKTKELHKLRTKANEDLISMLVYAHMDLNTMEEKCKDRKYKYLDQFQADTEIILHNAIICYGDSGLMAELSNIMMRDCSYDVTEIIQCKDCYYFSNAKPKDWFCQPCRPPHDLVYAKQKGFSYWPAKVIKVSDEGYDVRFFGGWHQRAVIPKTSVKPMDSNMKSLHVKKTGGFIKASKELERHKELLKNVKDECEDDLNEEEEEEEVAPSPPKNEVVEEEEEPMVPKNEVVEEEEEHMEEEEIIPSASATPTHTPTHKKRKRSRVDMEEEDTLEHSEDGAESDRRVSVSSKKVKRVKLKEKKKKEKVESRVDMEEEDTIEHSEDGTESDRRVSVSSKKVKRANLKEKKTKKEKVESDEYDEAISSSIIVPEKPASTPEDANLVSSSMDMHSPKVLSMTDIGTQTSKKLTLPKMPNKFTQTSKDLAPKVNCDCEKKFNKIVADMKRAKDEEHKIDKKMALKEQSEKLHKEFEEKKQKAVNHAIEKTGRDVDKAKEDKLREQYKEDIKKMVSKHKAEISSAKKKQWCYNCEKEAMYHCCWNTSYCSIECQQEHWHREHKKSCRRKR